MKNQIILTKDVTLYASKFRMTIWMNIDKYIVKYNKSKIMRKTFVLMFELILALAQQNDSFVEIFNVKAAEVGNVNSDMTANVTNNQTSHSLRVPG